jgi:hypothetical protein
MMRRVKITGGPSPATIKIIDIETGVDLAPMVVAFDWVPNVKELQTVRLTMFAELDIEAEADITVLPLPKDGDADR